MISLSNVLLNLARRGLKLRIDQHGNLFIHDPNPRAKYAQAEAEADPDAEADAEDASDAGAGAGAGAGANEGANADAVIQDGAPGAKKPRRRRRRVIPEGGIPKQHQQPAPRWRGICWEDVPGHDANIKKLNFSLLRRGLLIGYQSCAGLEGAALKQELQELSDRNRLNSRTEVARARNGANSTRRHPPP